MALVELRINDLAVVAGARLEPGAGFTAITGETGAGKSVCLAALRLALGGRSEAGMVRSGSGAARAVAVFDGVPAGVRRRLEELGIPDDELLTLSRELPRSGRATARVNGAMVSQATLAELGEALADITVQGASQRLLQRAWQRRLLDAFAGRPAAEARSRMAARLGAWRQAREALDHANRLAAGSAEELRRAREVAEELRPLRLAMGEEEALAAEAGRLRHGVAIAAAAEAMRVAAGGCDDGAGAADLLAAAVESARPLVELDDGLRALVGEAAEAVLGLRDLSVRARHQAESVPVDDRRLAAVEERLDTLARVRRRHGTIEAALRSLAAAEELLSSGGAREGEGRREAVLRAAAEEAAAAAGALSKLRQGAARRLAREVTGRLRTLELPHARFEIRLGTVPDPEGLDLGEGPVRCGGAGADEIEFLLTANRDCDPRPLDSGPSGGELSRLALALGAVVTEDSSPLLVLDEVDGGISGETAARVGDALAAIGRQRQVIAVTHRSEIAARAGRHLLAAKRDAGGVTRTEVRALEGAERAAEIARLMSGRATRAAMARADELLVEGAGAARVAVVPG